MSDLTDEELDARRTELEREIAELEGREDNAAQHDEDAPVAETRH